MTQDPELKAMNDIYQILEPLDKQAQLRVLRWVGEKLEMGNLGAQKPAKSTVWSTHQPDATLSSHESIADLFAAVSPRSDVEKVLVASAYLQEKLQKSELTGREINKELHHLGHRVSNVTAAVTNLMKRKPQLMIQTKKEGKSQQANKKYRVTTEGLKFVQQLTSNPTE